MKNQLRAMNDIIRLLPDSVANQIAAGEVIERPASVVKELVENAVDAGATEISVIIKDAGRTLVQVVDNGKGMSETDARLAFERHATSKIARADDLFALHTMGFRGEALASIAAVAQVDMRTMPHGADLGTRIVINGSRVESQEPEACSPGTNLMVKNLFFNIPVRRKFLKRDSVELAQVMREFERLALVNPGLDFELINNDTTVHRMRGAKMKQRILDLFGAGLDKQLLPVSTSTSVVTIEGFIGRPEHARKRNALQYLMVNGRHMRHPYFHKAIMMCYDKLIPSDSQPNYFLSFTVDPQTIDVNIHPTKSEIKFENEQAVWQILSAAVRESLGRFNAVPGIDFNSEEVPEIPVFAPKAGAGHEIEVDIDPGYNPFRESRPSSAGFASPSSLRTTGAVNNWEELYAGFMGHPADTPASAITPAQESHLREETVEARLINTDDENTASSDDFTTIHIAARYIMSPTASGMMIINQHRAHVKVLFEQFMAQLADGPAPSQRVMFAEIMNLTAPQNAILNEILRQVEDCGFELSFLGDNSWSIVAQPAMLSGIKPQEALLRIIDDAQEGTGDATDSWKRRMALSLAQSAAICGGKPLTAAEREHLLGQLLKLPTPNYTPDGKIIIRIMSPDDIAALFS